MPSIDLSRHKKKPGTLRTVAISEISTEGFWAFMNRDISFSGNELPDKKKESLYMELGSLLKAGIDSKSSFELIISGQEKEKDKQLFQKIYDDVLKGMPFSEALEKSGKFSTYEVYSLQIGEETGKLTEVLHDLAKFYKNKIKQRQKVVSSLTYPAIVMSTSFGAVFFMLKYVVPMFGEVFKRFGGQLPWLTQQILSISQYVQDYFFYFMLVTIAVGSYLYYIRKTEAFQKHLSAFVLRIPVAGNIVQKIYLARFCNSMRLLIDARLPLLRAISLSKQMIGYYPIVSSLQQVEDDILQGKSLHQSLEKFAIYPPKMIQLLKVGEEGNNLGHFFDWIAEQYIEEVEYKTATLSSSMQPLIILFLGFFVGLILISMYLPMMQMSTSIN